MTVPVASVANASPARERGLNPDEIIARNFEVTIPGLGCRIAMEWNGKGQGQTSK
jgi:hypothetical protein